MGCLKLVRNISVEYRIPNAGSKEEISFPENQKLQDSRLDIRYSGLMLRNIE
jgi:hypothetical protein